VKDLRAGLGKRRAAQIGDRTSLVQWRNGLT
jgi:hypothetical protein